MKIVIALLVFIAVSAASPIFLDIPRDNNQYVESLSRYIWMQQGQGERQLMDREGPVDVSAVSGADNQYWLFTRQNPTNKQIFTHNDIYSVRNSNYRGDRGTVVYVHGWNSTSPTGGDAMTSAFLAVMDVNVIMLDWRQVAALSYFESIAKLPDVANFLGDFLIWLIHNAGGNWNQVHLLGHSLGAHLVGVAGRRTGSKVGRVTGLDPAGIGFGIFQPQHRNRLTKDAGRYVEAIHTDGHIAGIMDRSADADFYPNGGAHPQPGCTDDLEGISCSHGRARKLLISSILTHDRFVGRQCNSLREAQRNLCTGAELHMGNNLFNKTGSGIYGLKTGASWPF